MKRSEMVMAIAECLVQPHFPDDALLEATVILKKLEIYGMLPPSVMKSPNYSNARIPAFYRNEWEAEDEKE